MATNFVQEGRRLTLAGLTGKVVGDPVAVGQITGVCTMSADPSGIAVVDTQGVYRLSVKAVDGGGNSAVAIGDIIYYVDGDTPKLSKKATGVPFGYALETVTAGSTSTIKVLLGK